MKSPPPGNLTAACQYDCAARNSTPGPAKSRSRNCTSRTKACGSPRPEPKKFMQLAKATIGELTGNNDTKENFDVQFNPATLRLQITNSVEGGDSRGRQVRQYLGSSSTTLTCDLIFDTA